MSKKSRLDKASRAAGGDEDTVIVLSWAESGGDPSPDQVVNVGGVKMTWAEYERRYPDHETINLSWGDIGDE